jgi:hypothetical protein
LDAETETWGWNQSKEFSTRSPTLVASIWWKGLLSAILYLFKRSIPKFTLFFKNSDEPMQAREVANLAGLNHPANSFPQFSEAIRTTVITLLASV